MSRADVIAGVLAEHEPVLGWSSLGTSIVGCSCLSARDYRAAGHKAGQAGYRAHVAAVLAAAEPAAEQAHAAAPTDAEAALARVRALADDLATEVAEMRQDLPPEGTHRIAVVYRTAGVAETHERLRAALTPADHDRRNT